MAYVRKMIRKMMLAEVRKLKRNQTGRSAGGICGKSRELMLARR